MLRTRRGSFQYGADGFGRAITGEMGEWCREGKFISSDEDVAGYFDNVHSCGTGATEGNAMEEAVWMMQTDLCFSYSLSPFVISDVEGKIGNLQSMGSLIELLLTSS